MDGTEEHLAELSGSRLVKDILKNVVESAGIEGEA